LQRKDWIEPKKKTIYHQIKTRYQRWNEKEKIKAKGQA
jgi:hypothetical protein